MHGCDRRKKQETIVKWWRMINTQVQLYFLFPFLCFNIRSVNNTTKAVSFIWPENIALLSTHFYVNNKNSKRCEICSKLTIQRHWRRCGVFVLILSLFHTLFQCLSPETLYKLSLYLIWAMSIGRVSSRKKGMGSSMFDNFIE